MDRDTLDRIILKQGAEIIAPLRKNAVPEKSTNSNNELDRKLLSALTQLCLEKLHSVEEEDNCFYGVSTLFASEDEKAVLGVPLGNPVTEIKVQIYFTGDDGSLDTSGMTLTVGGMSLAYEIYSNKNVYPNNQWVGLSEIKEGSVHEIGIAKSQSGPIWESYNQAVNLVRILDWSR